MNASASAAARPRKEIDTSTYTGRFAERLKMFRVKTGFSVDEFSVKTGIPRTTLFSWEQGVRTPPIEKLPELAAALGVKIRTLMPEK